MSDKIAKYPGCNGICAFEPWERETIKKDERNKVLDDLFNRIKNLGLPPGHFDAKVTIGEIHKIYLELRKR